MLATVPWLLAHAALAQNGVVDWLETEKVRAAYHYGRPPVVERIRRLKDVGVNCIILKCDVDRAMPWLPEAKKHGLKCFLAFNFNVNAEKKGLRQAVLDDGRVEAYACPIGERFWHEHFTPALMERVKLAANPEYAVTGLWIDFELYSNKTGRRYYTHACYCDYCFSEFCKHKAVDAPSAAAAARAAWLTERGFAEEYQPFLRGRIEALASELRSKVHAASPGFLLGFYPSPHNWSLVGVARGFATDRVPIVLWATRTYSGGGADRVPDDWRQEFAEKGVNARYVAGMLLRCYSAKNLAANLYHATQKCDGYWLFTTYTLNLPEEEQRGDYHLAAGSPSDYWQAIALGNAEIRKRLERGPDYQTQLAVGREPVVFRPLRQPELRQQLAALASPEDGGRTVSLPKVKLRGTNVLVVAGKAGKPVSVTLAFEGVNDWQESISWKAIGPEGFGLGEGAGAKQADANVGFVPEKNGIHFLIASAGSCCWHPLRTNAPIGLYAGQKLHTMHGAGKLYFSVPANVPSFTVKAKGASQRETVRVNVFDPANRLVASGQTSADQREKDIAVSAAGQAGAVWSLCITAADTGILEDNYVTLPPPLPPVLSLLPEHVFTAAAAE